MKRFLVVSSLVLLYSSLYFLLKPSCCTESKAEVKPVVKKKSKSNRCKATSQEGKRCKRKPLEESNFCWQHRE